MTLAIILGGISIRGGVFTAIEAGAVACVYAFHVTMLAIYYRRRDSPPLAYYTLVRSRC